MKKSLDTSANNLGDLHSPLPEGCPQGGVSNKSGLIKKPIFINGIEIKQRIILDLPYNNKLKERARLLRQARNLPEVLFWMQVTNGNFHKIDFDRQRVIGNYIVDFYIKALGLIIEIDGSSHDDKEVYDKIREDYFISLGLRVYRISVDDVMKTMKFALMGLENYIIEHYGVKT